MAYEWLTGEDSGPSQETVWIYVFTVAEEPLPKGVFASLERAEAWIASNWSAHWRYGALIRYVLDRPMSMGEIPPYFRYSNGQRELNR